jgi:hypothetical protein
VPFFLSTSLAAFHAFQVLVVTSKGSILVRMNNRAVKRTKSFAHVVLFKCPGSGDPIGAAFLSDSKNLEEVDAHTFAVKCVCGWDGSLLGIHRVNGWVEDWN